MKRRSFRKMTGLIVALILLVLISACGGGGDSAGTPTTSTPADLNPTAVTSSLDNIGTYMPGCEAVAATAQSAGIRETVRKLSALSELVATFKGNQTKASKAALPPIEAQTIQGDCGGTAAISSTHASGDTTFSVSFDHFCSQDASDPTSTQSTINGSLNFVEDGTPTDAGPSISRYTASVTNLAVNADGVETKLNLGSLVYTLGAPGVEPGIPTEASPDRLSIDSLKVTYVSQGNKTHQLNNLSASTWESGDNNLVSIASGVYVTSTHGSINIATSAPLTMNTDGELVSGQLDLTGANGGTVSLTPSATNGVFGVSVDGQPVKNLDCSSNDSVLSSFL